MTNKEILQADILDILFEHRNKIYGAYALRKQYNNRLGLALGISVSLVIAFVLFSFMGKNNNVSKASIPLDDSSAVKVRTIDIEPDLPKEKQQPKIKQVKSVNRIQLVPDYMETDIPDQNDIVDAVVGNQKVIGTALIDPNEIVSTISKNIPETTAVENTTDLNFVPKEISPSFPGGVAAWLNFLRKYLQSPDELDAGQKVEVRVKFRIEKDGSLSGFEIVQSGGNLFDREVLRVMKKMPKWEPAFQNNSRIAVTYTQPVIFMGVEE